MSVTRRGGTKKNGLGLGAQAVYSLLSQAKLTIGGNQFVHCELHEGPSQVWLAARGPRFARLVPDGCFLPRASDGGAWSFMEIHMYPIMAHGVGLCRRSLLTTPEINLSPSSLWKSGFGGLNRRFKNGFYKDVRLTDPWAGEVLRFQSQLHADNWLLRAFDPACRSYALASSPMRVLNRGRLLSVQFFAQGYSRGSVFADLVVSKEGSESNAIWEQFCIAAHAHGVMPVMRLKDDIRSNLVLLDNLEAMRSHLVMHVYLLQQARRLTPFVLKELTRGPRRVHELTAKLCSQRLSVSDASVDFALFRAYRRDELHLDVASVRYGRNSIVSERKGQ
ncbi:MAG: hypothetical protein KIS62_00785 [Ramlibacter sp.]|nr:hypothetical protein [Ramlibacter sp.]